MQPTIATQPNNCLTVVSSPISALVCDPKNARLHPERHIKQLARSIQSFDFNCPILIDAHNNVIAGHGRLMAVKQLGWTEVPTIRLDHLTPDQVRAYRLADNRLTDCSTWDERLLAQELKYLSEADLNFDIEAIGFVLPEIDLLVQGLGDLDDDPDAQDIEPSSGPPVSQVGDVWQLGAHRIICGDSLQVATYDGLLGTHHVAMVFTDPPFNVPIAGHVSGNGRVHHAEFAMASGEMSIEAFTSFLTQAIAQMKRVSVQGALLYLAIDWRHLDEMSAAGRANALALKNIAIWDKGCGGMGSFYRSQYEMFFIFKSGTAKHTNNVQLGRFGRNRTNLWRVPGLNSFARNGEEGNLLANHPTPKPVVLIADALLDASERGDRILDPFLGGGSTVIAAEKTGRICYGIEIEPRYVDVAVRRWQRLTGQKATHAQSNHTFDQLAEERATRGVPFLIEKEATEGVVS